MANDRRNTKRTDPELNRQRKEEQGRRSRRRNRQILGFVLSVLIIWGAVSIVESGIQLARDLTDNSEEMLEYEEKLQTMVWFDVLPFDNVYQIDEYMLKQVAIWSVYQSGDGFERDDYGSFMIPVLDVDLWARNMFGPSFVFTEHEAFTEPIHALSYDYDEELNVYKLPITGLQPEYLPVVVDIQRESGGGKRVVMGYAATRLSEGEILSSYDFDHPVRYMDYIFRREGNEYYLDRLERNTTRTVTTPETTSQMPESAIGGENEPAESDIITSETTSLPAVTTSSETAFVTSLPLDTVDEAGDADEADGGENSETGGGTSSGTESTDMG